MDNKNINLIRDSAKKLIQSNPLMAYKLFHLALQYRPTGWYLIEQERKLKKQLNIKKFIVIGNCQAKPLSELIEHKNPHFIVDKSIAAHLYKYDASIHDSFKKADYIITQNISNNFKGINTQLLKEQYPDKVVVIPGLYFKGEHPDWFYPPNTNGKRLKGPAGHYHNKTVMDSFAKGLSVEQTLSNLNSYEYNVEHYEGVALESLKELKIREQACDTKISDVIEAAYNNSELLFHTINHPNKQLMNTHCNRILEYLNLEFNKEATQGECLDLIRLSNNVISSKMTSDFIFKQGIKVNKKHFVTRAFDFYSKYNEYIEQYRNTLID